ncbi:MAG: circadian clock protein KaiC [Fibrobacter sp.]|nr:circadian clock protein KaiC [Fibrobacter sp.]
MVKRATSSKKRPRGINKTPTGINGFDEITYGGLPKGRPTLVAGRAGCGKTLFSMEFLARGVQVYGEPGVFMSFEERTEELITNFNSLGFDLQELINKNLLIIDHVAVEKAEIEETGEYNLDGLFVRLNYAIKSVKAKRVVLDTVESLFSGLANQGIIRAELRRLFRWLKDQGVTAIITGERGKETENVTRHGLEEYVADCVILLDHIVNDRIATRRLRILKYRGSAHGTDEYPFLIDETGISVLPITSLSLDHSVGNERISSGVERLDTMLEGKGFYRGSSILVSGTSGTGKSTLAATFASSACKNGEKVLYFAFEEAPQQIIRNMRSVGIELESCIKKGTLRIESSRPTIWGLEMHLATIHKEITKYKPQVVIIDPISNFISIGNENEVRSMLTRLIDYIKMNNITALFTDLITGDFVEVTRVGVSSLMDVWILVKSVEADNERNRTIYILKARGIAHSNQMREFLLTPDGVDIIDVYTGPAGVLTGTGRVKQEAADNAERLLREQEFERKQRDLKRSEEILENQINLLRVQYEAKREETLNELRNQKIREEVLEMDRRIIAKMRKSDSE